MYIFLKLNMISNLPPGSILMVIGVHQYSGEGRRGAQAHFKGRIGTNTTVEEGICQEEPARLPL